ncbi:MAG: hydroxypyruvate isomerase family protein [Pigmentiphaga sp.]
MELAANLSWLYPELAWSERFAAAARDGFRAAEILLPYDHPPAWYAARLRDASLELVLLNTPIEAGRGHRGWAAVPGAEAQFDGALDRARAVAEATGCRRVHVMAGDVSGLSASDCAATLRRNLERALRRTEAEGLVLTLEALNRVDMPGYCYYLPEQVIAVLHDVRSPRLRMQFDYYHVVKEGLDLQATLASCSPWIGHAQIAGAEGRHEPDLDRDGLLDAVAALPGLGYDSWLGCEYAPRGLAAQGLGWCEPLRTLGVLTPAAASEPVFSVHNRL